MFQKEKVYNFQDFMRGQHAPCQDRGLKMYSFVSVSPLALFDPMILTVAAGILSIVFLEKMLEGGSLFLLGEYLARFIGVMCPVLVFGAIIYFIMTNPFILWG